MSRFTAEQSLQPRWSPGARGRAIRWFGGLGVIFVLLAAGLGAVAGRTSGAVYWVAALGLVFAGLAGLTCLAAAVVILLPRVVGRLLAALALPIFVAFIAGIVVLAWMPRVLYDWTDQIVGDQKHLFEMGAVHDWPTISVASFRQYVLQPPRYQDGSVPEGTPGPWSAPVAGTMAYVLWPLQFQITRDVLSMVGVVGFVSLVAMFGIWWERKVAARIQSRLGPMRVGQWHGWAQSLADGIKLIQKEDIFTTGADKPLFRLAAYATFVPAMCLFLAMPFSAAYVTRDMDVGLIFILAMIGMGVIGVLIAGWASNNKWSMFGAMREACQMISYEIPLGFSLLVPVITAGTLRLTAIGEMQSGGFQSWLAFSSPFTLMASLVFFIATLASCKRAPFDLPEAESELVAGYHTEYSGYRWALFFFAEYAEMFAVGALAAVLFFGAWYSPLPAEWGEAWAHGTLWQRGLHGLVYSGPLWLIFKGFFFFYLQIWLRWTLPRVRLDQVMYACVQVMLPLIMVILLGQTLWLLLVPPTGLLARVANAACTAVGVLAVVGIVVVVLYGLAHRRRLVGTQAVDHLPGA